MTFQGTVCPLLKRDAAISAPNLEMDASKHRNLRVTPADSRNHVSGVLGLACYFAFRVTMSEKKHPRCNLKQHLNQIRFYSSYKATYPKGGYDLALYHCGAALTLSQLPIICPCDFLFDSPSCPIYNITPLNLKPLNPQTLNLKPLNPKPQNPKPMKLQAVGIPKGGSLGW